MSQRPRHLAPVPAPAQPATPAPLLVTMTESDLRRVIADEVRRALEERASEPHVDVDWIDGDEAARMLGVSRDYLRRVRGLPRYGSPRTPRYRRSEVDAFLRERAGVPFGRG